MRRLSLTEMFMIEFILYTLLWLWNDLVASMLSLSFTVIAILVLIISLVADSLDKSRVDRWYYQLMVISAVTPFIVSAFFGIIKKGQFDWMHPF